ncbi:hypothetical protein [Kineothrix sp. MB12-C1]|uniref:hypothetical protein n=1 Tax=Kineothrix sp. MB12-C1 TaxID=3070215 RepID=UPI0027D2B9F1|nr:hypothetical protein [Kineothrix sp. MB12-C1]WMC92309.1 DNA polymerase domain-containing protein [Kineothrix sp. MB12-C1]
MLDGMNPSYINDQLILYDKKGFQVVTNSKQYHLNNYDVILKDKSLKQLEAFMGDVIKETEVPFDIERLLAEEEEKEIISYNIHDVRETLKVLDATMGDFEAQLDMISMFDLDMEMFNKTKAQLASTILGAVQQHTLDDEFDITIPANLRMPEKYQYIVDWYKKPENKSYKLPLKTDVNSNSTRQLVTTVGGVPCVYGYGGLHGSKDNEIFEGILVAADVASLYPSLMINEGFASRKLKNSKDFENMRDRRLELKKIKDKRQQPLKIVINSAYGILKDRNSACFDPVQSNNVCIAGQLYLTELAAKLEDICELLQLNTDGIYLRVKELADVDKVKAIAKEWEIRTNLELEFDVYEHGRLVQKDVNNYLLIDLDSGHYKCKGAYVKKLSTIDYDLPILNKALVNYFVHDIPVENTINEAKELIEFQKVIKLTTLFKGVVYGTGKNVKVDGKDKTIVEDGIPLKEKVHRVFASTRPEDKGIYKIKVEKGQQSYEKIALTPDRCFINNDDINGVLVPEYLDRQYYIDAANERIKQFTEKTEEKVDETPNILFDCMCKSETFYDFLEKCQENHITNKVLEGYLIADCCSNYGKTNKLLTFRDYFNQLYGKNKMTVSTLDKKITNEKVKSIVINNSVLSKTGKTYGELDSKKSLQEIFDYLENDDIEPYKIMEMQVSKFNTVRYKNEELNDNRWFVLNTRDIISPNIIIYNMKTGETRYSKVNKHVYKILPLQDGDIIDVIRTEKEFGKKIIGKNDDGINIVAADINNEYDVITQYDLVYRNYGKGKSLLTDCEVC